jgi:DNA-binding Lrp family transcriptional regulator
LASNRDDRLLKDFELRLIAELVRDCRRSDRELAKVLHVSQPTVTRTRTRLEKQGLVEYGASPNLAKLGYKIMAVVFGKRDYEKHPEDVFQKAKSFVERHPNILFASDGSGLDHDRMTISIHRSYSDYSIFMQEMRAEVEDIMILDSFLIDLTTENVLRAFSQKHLADDLKSQNSSHAHVGIDSEDLKIETTTAE